ncbi:hypothetical protein M378DRAFT_18613 [Amanita muscaria Koide BX008]|uniref:Uncharacterized protein n=1 Tax=Amanita muscaria (strain Koide BX008) TaxID=946122 RepID=A0A0C2WF43_AMAMK|nr:hypothetical protein M378DRAFT_18613 [Amanita muscaria Koide BX008]
MSSPTVPSYVFPDTRSPSPALPIPIPITLPVLAPLPVSAHYIPVNNADIPYWSDNEGITYIHSQASSRAPTPGYQPPRPMSTSPVPLLPLAGSQSPPPPSRSHLPHRSPPPPLLSPPVCPSPRLMDIYERLRLSNDMRERVHQVIGILWNEENMTSVTHQVTQAGNPALFDLLEIFQNTIHMEFHTPGVHQLQDHLTVDLTLRMIQHGIKMDIYCAMHGLSWGEDNGPIFHNAELMDRAGVNRPFHASIHDHPPPTPRLRMGRQSGTTQRELENQNQALRNLLRDMEEPETAPLSWEETSFLDNIIGRQRLANLPSSVTTIPPFDSLNPTAPVFIPAQPTPRSPQHSRQPFTEISMNNPQDLSLVTRRARRRQRAQNATARRPNIPPPPPTQPHAPQTARRGRPRHQIPCVTVAADPIYLLLTLPPLVNFPFSLGPLDP